MIVPAIGFSWFDDLDVSIHQQKADWAGGHHGLGPQDQQIHVIFSVIKLYWEELNWRSLLFFLLTFSTLMSEDHIEEVNFKIAVELGLLRAKKHNWLMNMTYQFLVYAQ